MRNFPTSFRFVDDEMQRELWAAVQPLGLSLTIEPDGTMHFKPEDWGAINAEAHVLREKRFGDWYFMNLTPESIFTRMIERLRAHSLPYVLEFHGPRQVLLLPKSDERRHHDIMIE
jgi:hypothetical protein